MQFYCDDVARVSMAAILDTEIDDNDRLGNFIFFTSNITCVKNSL